MVIIYQTCITKIYTSEIKLIKKETGLRQKDLCLNLLYISRIRKIIPKFIDFVLKEFMGKYSPFPFDDIQLKCRI